LLHLLTRLDRRKTLTEEHLALIAAKYWRLLQRIGEFRRFKRPRNWTKQAERAEQRRWDSVQSALFELVSQIPGTTGAKLYYRFWVNNILERGGTIPEIARVFGLRRIPDDIGIFDVWEVHLNEAWLMINATRWSLTPIIATIEDKLGLTTNCHPSDYYGMVRIITTDCRYEYPTRGAIREELRRFGQWYEFSDNVEELMYFVPWAEEWTRTYHDAQGELEVRALLKVMYNLSIYSSRPEP
jgi:hypothetical protein